MFKTVQPISFAESSMHEHISPLLADLHWLPLSHRIMYKIATVCHNVILGSAPPYLVALLLLYTPSQSFCSSADSRIFHIPLRCKEFQGQCALSYNYRPCHLGEGPIFCPPCSNSVKFQISAKNTPLLYLFPSALDPAVSKSRFIKVWECACVCVCVWVYKVWVWERVLDWPGLWLWSPTTPNPLSYLLCM